MAEIKRTEVERQARTYLERSRGYLITPSDFERLVQREVALTIRQLCALGRR